MSKEPFEPAENTHADSSSTVQAVNAETPGLPGSPGSSASANRTVQILLALTVALAILSLYLYWQLQAMSSQRDEVFNEYIALKSVNEQLSLENERLSAQLQREAQELNIAGWLDQLEDESSSLLTDLSTVLKGAQRRFFDSLEDEVDNLKEKLNADGADDQSTAKPGS